MVQSMGLGLENEPLDKEGYVLGFEILFPFVFIRPSSPLSLTLWFHELRKAYDFMLIKACVAISSCDVYK